MPTSLYTSALEYYWEFNVKKAVFGRRKNKQLVCKWYTYIIGGCMFVYTSGLKHTTRGPHVARNKNTFWTKIYKKIVK